MKKRMSDPDRGTGRTTGLMLQAISKALLNKGENIEFIDHAKQGYNEAVNHSDRMECIIDGLWLSMCVSVRGNRVFVRSLTKTEGNSK